MSKTYKLVDKIEKRGFPTSSKLYKKAHRIANKYEKKKYPKGFKDMEKIDEKLPNHQLAGTNKKSGKLEVSKKVPPKYRKEVAFHERTESLAFKKLMKKFKK